MKNIIICKISGHEEAYMCDESIENSRPATQEELDILTAHAPYKIVNNIVTLDVDAIRNRQESENKSRRSVYMDAYRKYQAAVNYGEFEKNTDIDDYIQRLKDKDWAALDTPPPMLLYFCGEQAAEVLGEP